MYSVRTYVLYVRSVSSNSTFQGVPVNNHVINCPTPYSSRTLASFTITTGSLTCNYSSITAGRKSSAIMASHQLAIAKLTLSAGLIRPDPHSVPKDEIAHFHALLDKTLARCSPTNVQV